MSTNLNAEAKLETASEAECLMLIDDLRDEIQLLLLNGHIAERKKSEILKDVISILGGLN